MALKPKFCIPWIVMNAILISLSASSAEEPGEGHRCYWCGPLAEQVHRSQRAPMCSGDRSKVTVCEENLPYCAIVAKSPPYVESRYCVKVYHDECYSQYCNTTKTWKITCPCRGELCNGINTLRENEAFKALKQNIGKPTHNNRSKRRLMSNVGFLSTNKNKMNNTITEENNKAIYTKIVTEETKEDTAKVVAILNIENDNITANTTNETTELQITTEGPFNYTTEITSTGSSPHVKTDATFSEISVAVVPDPISTADGKKKVIKNYEEHINNTELSNENNANKTSEYNKQVDILSANIMSEDLKTEIILMSSDIPKLVSGAADSFTNITGNTPTLQTTSPTKPTILDSKLIPESTIAITNATPGAKTDVTISKSGKRLPAAEGIENSITPTTKTEKMLPTTSNDMSIHNDVTTQAVMSQNNSAIRIVNTQIFTVVIGIVIYYFYV